MGAGEDWSASRRARLGLISVAAISVALGPVSGLWLVFPLGVLALAAARGPGSDGRS